MQFNRRTSCIPLIVSVANTWHARRAALNSDRNRCLLLFIQGVPLLRWCDCCYQRKMLGFHQQLLDYYSCWVINGRSYDTYRGVLWHGSGCCHFNDSGDCSFTRFSMQPSELERLAKIAKIEMLTICISQQQPRRTSRKWNVAQNANHKTESNKLHLRFF